MLTSVMGRRDFCRQTFGKGAYKPRAGSDKRIRGSAIYRALANHYELPGL